MLCVCIGYNWNAGAINLPLRLTVCLCAGVTHNEKPPRCVREGVGIIILEN